MTAASPASDPERSSAAAKDGASRRRGRKAQADGSVEVQLEHGRWRHFGWAALGVAVGALLLWKLGALGKGLGIAALGLAAYNLYRFAGTLRFPAGRIRVAEGGVDLPDGLCRGKAHHFAMADVRHAFFLRRAVPWSQAGPVLVVEAGEQVFVYPRDWFASDSDQRRVARAIHRHLERPPR